MTARISVGLVEVCLENLDENGNGAHCHCHQSNAGKTAQIAYLAKDVIQIHERTRFSYTGVHTCVLSHML